jgi:uncharacterized protein YdaU (DUF1376 family)
MAKVRDPAMPMYVADWLSSEAVTAMTLEQQGAFVRLLSHAWLSGTCSLPDSDTALAALSTLGDRWTENAPPIRRCFKARRIGNETRIVNEKLLKVWKDRRSYAERGQKGGVNSGAARRSAAKQTRSKTPSKDEAKSNITVTVTSTSTNYKKSVIDASLSRISEQTLKNTAAFLQWLADAAETAGADNSEHSQIRLLALATRCLERGKNPSALFVAMFKEGKFDHLNNDDFDEASRRIKEIRGKPFGGMPELAGLANFGRNPNL